MKQAYKHRPKDFKRRIIKYITTNRIDLYEEEQRWLNMIKKHEIKIRYYNFTRRANGIIVTEEMRKTHSIRLRELFASPRGETIRQIMSEKRKGKSPSNKGKPSQLSREQHQQYGRLGGLACSSEVQREKTRKANGRGGQRAAELGKCGFQQKVTCPHCKQSGNLVAMHRWHFTNCRHFPVLTYSS
jgi:hypothetical protein